MDADEALAVVVDEGQEGEYAPRGRLLREDQADAAAVFAGLAVGGVVDLQDDVRSGADELRLARLEFLRRLSGRVADQKVAGKFAGVGIVAGFRFGGNKGDAGLRLFQPVRSGFADEGDDVVNVGAGCAYRLHMPASDRGIENFIL